MHSRHTLSNHWERVWSKRCWPALYSASSSCAARTGLIHQEIDKGLLGGVLWCLTWGCWQWIPWVLWGGAFIDRACFSTNRFQPMLNGIGIQGILEGRVDTLVSLVQSFVPALQQCLGGWRMSNVIHAKSPLCWMIDINCFICWWLW